MIGIFGYIVIILGLVTAIWPYTAWYLQIGWKLKDAKPTHSALQMQRVVGIVIVIIGAIMIFSSLSPGAQSDPTWQKHFKEKLSQDQVQEITIGMFHTLTLSEEDKITVIEMIKAAELRPIDSTGTVGFSQTGNIVFTNGTSVEFVIIAPSGAIELHPTDTDQRYEIMSDQLQEWIRKKDIDQL